MARTWFHKGQIQGAYQLITGTIIVPDEIFDTDYKDEKTVIYTRVSRHDQTGDS